MADREDLAGVEQYSESIDPFRKADVKPGQNEGLSEILALRQRVFQPVGRESKGASLHRMSFPDE
jgi:hypothetical protein